MEIFVLDELFRSLYNLDAFESLIWTERYNGYGNFEFYTSVNDRILETVNAVQDKMEEDLDCYAWLKESGNLMIIEDIEITTDAESGNHLIVSGRGLESLLERRIIWDQTALNGNLQNGVKRLLDDSIISPKISDRKIPNFLFQESTDEYIKSLTLQAQYTGDNLYDTILTICDTYQLGFNVSLDQNNNFVFSLQYGEDRSYDQEKNPYVIFSPRYENIINSDYLESDKTLKNVTLVAGEGEGSARVKLIVGNGIGLKRRELFTDARDLQSADYSENITKNEEILNDYKQKLSEDQQSLSEETKVFNDETTEYNKKKTAYEQSKASHQTRITNFQTRITYYNQKITDYGNNLTADQKVILTSRNNYKTQSDNYETLINACSNKINEYNNKLSNEENITYAKIIEYEQGIDSEEAKRSGYETQRNAIEQSKTEEEKKLPNYETTLKDYESKVSKYQGIVADDQQDITDETTEFNKETTEYNKKKTAYEQTKAKYESDINGYQIKITEYENTISEEKILLSGYYNSLLERRGKEKLSEHIYTKVFTGEIEATKTYIFNRDFFIGDSVQIVNEYSMESKVRVSEVVRVQDANGYSMYPTFQVIE